MKIGANLNPGTDGSNIVHISDFRHCVISCRVHRREAAGDLTQREVADEINLQLVGLLRDVSSQIDFLEQLRTDQDIES